MTTENEFAIVTNSKRFYKLLEQNPKFKGKVKYISKKQMKQFYNSPSFGIPLPLCFRVEKKKFVAGYCPTCGGTVYYKKTWVRKIKGACCSWCGQNLDLWSEKNDIRRIYES